MATITLNLFTATKAAPAPKPKDDDDDSGFVGGVKRGWDGFTGAAAWVAEAVGTLLPFLVLLLLLGIALRVFGARLPRLPRRNTPTPIPSRVGQGASSAAAARKRSFSSGLPIVTRAPAPAKPRTITRRVSHPLAQSVVASPSGSHTKFACVGGTS